MSIRDFAIVIVRFFGLWQLFQCIYMVEQAVLAVYAPWSNTSPAYNRFIAIMSVFNFFLNLVVGIVLTWKPGLVADRLPPTRAKEAGIRLTSTSLIFLGFAVTGVVFTLSGLKGLVYEGAVWLSGSDPLWQTNVNRARVITSTFSIVMGLWLVCGFKGIFRGVRGMWRAGKNLGTTHSGKET